MNLNDQMRLLTLEYKEHKNEPQEWSITGLYLTAKNLIVGKNSSGKSRTLNIIHSLSRAISGQQLMFSGHYIAHFEHDGADYFYQLEYAKEEVVSESLRINDKIYLERGTGGQGKIIAEEIDRDNPIPFQTPTTNLAVFSRRDSIQHSFLEPLFLWASSLRFYPFSSYLGKDLFAILVPNAPKVDDRDHNAAVGLLREGIKQHGQKFKDAIIKDLAAIDYHITDIDIASPVSLKIAGLPGEPVGVYVQEKNLPGITDQHSMSVGMFRVLSLLIHLNFSELNKTATTILVDDIGEGLDFDRSCKLIDLLRTKADEQALQLILSTNDRFVMNSVPLEEWSVLVRNGNHVEVRNYKNSKEVFEDFKFTGLNNFSFLELDVINEN